MMSTVNTDALADGRDNNLDNDVDVGVVALFPFTSPAPRNAYFVWPASDPVRWRQ